MGHYVYRYMHPDYPWLYVGKTDTSLETRIRTHDTDKNDNISREYLPLLKESIVLYIELQNSLQTTYIEKLLIDKYKPTLNKADKIETECPIEFSIPKWRKYIRKFEIPEKFLSKENVTKSNDSSSPKGQTDCFNQKTLHSREDDLEYQFYGLTLCEQHIFLYLCKRFVDSHSLEYTFAVDDFLRECYIKSDNQNDYDTTKSLLYDFYSRDLNIILNNYEIHTRWIGKVYFNSKGNTVTVHICEDTVPFMDKFWNDYNFVLPVYTEVV